ncbi:bis(monoacylglycero)phosphate synthase CLN5-like [Haliotis asinina]|uniref:bis(monoacylglycero)phosphate synthase CLN5-like n=1 Tax=Haliotis asinina TaxID=109174 RepID=UPI0035319AD5
MLLSVLILFSCGIFGTTLEAKRFDYVITHRRFESRPPVDPRCKVAKQFCYKGEPMVTFDDDDEIVIYSMRARGDPIPAIDLETIHHAGIGLHNLNTGYKYTLDWSPLFGSLNWSRPTLLEDDSFLWCNQGASCFSKNFNSIFYGPNAVRHPVAKTTGGPYWTDTWDCGNFVQRAFQALYDLGVRFYPDFQPTYDLAVVYTYMPEYLGNHTEIFGVNGDPVLAQSLISFFKTWGNTDLDHMYLYFNEAYWYAKLTHRAPDGHVQIVVPLPGYR